MSTAVAKDKAVRVDADPIPQFVQSIQAAWQRTYKARQQFLDETEAAEGQLAILFPRSGDYDQRITRNLELKEEDLFKIAKEFVQLITRKAQDLFTKTSVKLSIDPENYYSIVSDDYYERDEASSHYPQHRRVIATHPDRVEFSKVWYQLEKDFSGDKANEKTYKEAAKIIEGLGTGWDKGREAWVAANVKRQKKQTVMKFSSYLEDAIGERGRYRMSYTYRDKLVELFNRGIPAVADTLSEEVYLKTVSQGTATTIWNMRDGFDLGLELSSFHHDEDYWWTVIVRKSHIEIKMGHKLADAIIDFVDEHHWKVQGEDNG